MFDFAHPDRRLSTGAFRVPPPGACLLTRWILLLVLLVLPSAALGQSVFGRVLVAGDTLPVPGAELTLTDSSGIVIVRVQTDDLGDFRLPAPHGGTFLIRASRIGYATVSASVLVGERDAVEVELRMGEEAVALEPIVVVARRRIRQGTLDEFYDRMARKKQAGQGQFLTKEQLKAREAMSLPMLLQTLPGVWLPSGGGGIQLLSSSPGGGVFCTPEYYLDGQPMLGGYREIQVMDLEGVEVYRGPFETVGGYFPNPCGSVFLWRKRDWGNPFSWGRVFMLAGLAVVGFLISSLLGGGP